MTNGPDALWALIRQDPESSEPLRAALLWLHSREAVAFSLGAPSSAWEAWEDFIRRQPARFKACVKRTLLLDAARQRCLAALSSFHRQLSDLQGRCLVQDPESDLALLEEACPICRVAFQSRAAWACHASRLHGYRRHSILRPHLRHGEQASQTLGGSTQMQIPVGV